MLDPVAPDPAGMALAVAVLDGGGLVAFPTETFYGLGADPWNERALEALFQVKGRPESMPILLLLADSAQAEAAAERVPAAFVALARRFWPGPLTLVVEARAGLPSRLTSGTGTIGMRVPSAAIPRALARGLGRPVTGTSANRTGAPPARDARDVAASLCGDDWDGDGWNREAGDAGGNRHSRGEAPVTLDLLLDGGASPGGEPSTVVDLTGRGPRLVRAGAISFDAVLEALRTDI